MFTVVDAVGKAEGKIPSREKQKQGAVNLERTPCGSEKVAWYGDVYMNVGDPHCSARRAVFPDESKQRGWGEGDEGVGSRSTDEPVNHRGGKGLGQRRPCAGNLGWTEQSQETRGTKRARIEELTGRDSGKPEEPESDFQGS